MLEDYHKQGGIRLLGRVAAEVEHLARVEEPEELLEERAALVAARARVYEHEHRAQVRRRRRPHHERRRLPPASLPAPAQPAPRVRAHPDAHASLER